MALEIKTDKLGGEFKVDEGVELYAIWVPVTLAEKEALISKGKAEKIDVPKLTANFLRDWLKAGELSEGDLAKVAGGGSQVAAGVLNLKNLNLQSAKLYPGVTPDKYKLPDGAAGGSTYMCPW